MVTAGRTIRMFLADGSSTGIITAEIMNWTGHVLCAPRSRIVDVLRRAETSRTGVYILIGQDPKNADQQLLYIGETDNVRDRLTTHNRDDQKGFWERTCIVTSKDANLTKSHVRYLESRLISIANKEARARLQNGTAPDYGYLPEADIADMEYFIEQLQTLLPVLGLDYFRPTPRFSRAAGNELASETSVIANILVERASEGKTVFGQERPTAEGGKSPEFHFADRTGAIQARAIEADGQMVVLEGSEAREEERTSLASNVKTLRDQLRFAGKLVPSGKPGVLKFLSDVAFSSPSAAAQAIMGTSRNGRIDWFIENTGETYADWQEKQIAAAQKTEVDAQPEKSPV